MARSRGLAAFLAVLAVAAAFGAIAAAGASATNLCSEAPNAANECPAGKAYGVGQVFEAQAGAKTELKTPLLGTIVCENSEVTMKVTELAVGLAAVSEVQKFSFAGCKLGMKVCAMEGKPIPGISQIRRTVAGNGEIFFQAPAGGGNFFFETNCAGMVCKFSVAELTGNLTGGNAAEFAFAGAALAPFPAACGAGKFTAKYLMKNPKPLWATN